MVAMDRRNALTAAAMVTGMAAAGSAAQAAPRARRPSAAEQIDMLASRAAIEEVLFDYARGNDHADEAMIRACFWPEFGAQARRLRRHFKRLHRFRDEAAAQAQIFQAPHQQRLGAGARQPGVQRMLLLRPPPPRCGLGQRRGGYIFRRPLHRFVRAARGRMEDRPAARHVATGPRRLHLPPRPIPQPRPAPMRCAARTMSITGCWRCSRRGKPSRPYPPIIRPPGQYFALSAFLLTLPIALRPMSSTRR